eukprot:1632085-Pleurochrysis_carterae.AAC.1
MQKGCHERSCGRPDAGTTDSASEGIRVSSEAGAGSSAEDFRSEGGQQLSLPLAAAAAARAM